MENETLPGRPDDRAQRAQDQQEARASGANEQPDVLNYLSGAIRQIDQTIADAAARLVGAMPAGAERPARPFALGALELADSIRSRIAIVDQSLGTPLAAFTKTIDLPDGERRRWFMIASFLLRDHAVTYHP